jgi:hypothetical protein
MSLFFRRVLRVKLNHHHHHHRHQFEAIPNFLPPPPPPPLFEAIPNPATYTMSLTPLPPAIYPDPATGFIALQAHAKGHGYALFQQDKKPNKVVYTCDRAGKYDPKGKDPKGKDPKGKDPKGKDPNIHSSKQRTATGSKKCGHAYLYISISRLCPSSH